MTNSPTVKVPLAFASMFLSQLLEAADETQVDEAFLQLFRDADITHQDGIDRRIVVDKAFSTHIGLASEARTNWAAVKNKLEKAQVRFRQATKEIIEANPGLGFVGKLGTLKTQRNPPRITLAVGNAERLVRHLITKEEIEQFHIPSRYLKSIEGITLNMDEIKKDLADGVQLDWAKTEQVTRLVVKENY